MNNQPIGIFDSGIGGLTVAKAVTKLLPNEDVIYFGDTAHLPYGDKSTAAIQAYSVKIADFLIAKQCKVILIACNSASAAAYDLVKAYVGSKSEVLNVIDPAVDYVTQKYENRKIGLIGTVKTVSSQVYEHKIEEKNKNIVLKSLATKMLAPMIEEGFFENNISQSAISTYLSDASLQNIEALILGCTHYPLIKKQIDHYYDHKVDVIDTSEVVAQALKSILDHKKLNSDKEEIGTKQFFVSDYTQAFEEATKIFFGQSIKLQFFKLWE